MSNFYFPTELLIEVLLKLPVKSLIKFTSVCKSWQSLITSPAFISSHLSSAEKSSTENHVILRCYDKHKRRKLYSLLKVTEYGLNSFSVLEFPFKSEIPDYRIVASCHGLVCLSDCYYSENCSPHIIIWNPCIKSHVVLPKPVFNTEERHVSALGFGVADHVYKVVRLVYYIDHEGKLLAVPPVAEIFCSRIGRWRRVEVFDVRLQIYSVRQVYLKGIVHWLAKEVTIDNGHDSWRGSILTFEVGDEVFGEVMLPDELTRIYAMELRVFMIGESLGVIKSENKRDDCDVWMMNEYGVKESWTKLYTFHTVYGLQNIVGFCTSGEALFVEDRGVSKGYELAV